ncbi:hypothetical protein BUALT_Bualt03G0071200 [Buddleja alternifolia]|uniref:F-box domain-containing protein n=1 Tax=Buddleja alternifolia TaxID=168488 RepID=A0AAV6XSY4_9LAMI|nr:hypothetical protein BUALT_Bualt03G0071200 [Buddleja alternifolia]
MASSPPPPVADLHITKNDDPSMPIFPSEVIIEILTYMPIKSLTQLQLVCKDWRATIHDHYFIEKHMDRSGDVHHWHNVAQTTEDLKNSIAFSYVPATKSYRVVSVYNDEETGRECCEVFTPGHSETWKCLMFPENVNLNWEKEDKMVSVISSGGAVHCLLSVEVSNVTFEEVVSLDIETERFVVNSVPKSLFEDRTRVCALDWDGKLAFADIKGENLEVMELEDYRKQRWCGKKRVINLAFMKNNGVAFPVAIMESFTNSKNNSTDKAPEWLDLISIAQNRKNDDPSMPIFPHDVVTEILTYMPIKSLTQRQLVCKEWRATIHDHYFIEKHMDRSRDVHHWHNAVQTTESLINGSPDRVRISYIHGLDGLVLMRNTDTQKIFIWNPATRGVLELPDPHHDDNYGFTLSYIPATKNYRIVSVYEDKESGRESCEVLTPDHSETWRRLTFPENVNLNWHKKDKRVTVISSGGAVHCILTVVTFEEIVSLDIETERFAVNSVPKSFFEDWTRVFALDWDGKLGFAYANGENLEVMELEDYRKQRWCGKKRVIHLPFMKNNDVAVSKLHPLFARKGNIWFWLEDGRVFSYNIKTRRRNDVTQRQGLSVANKNYPYKPSLVTFEGMQPDTKLEIYRPRLCN